MMPEGSVEMTKEAFSFAAVVMDDQRQAAHLMRIAARIAPGGAAQVERTQCEGLLSLAQRGLRRAHMVTPIDTIIREVEPCRFDLTSLGHTLMKEMDE
jgi:hypothetical protein